MVKPFNLNNFVDDCEGSDNCAEFMSFFDTPLVPGPVGMADNVVDLEGQARKVFEDAYTQGEKAGFEMGMKKVEPLIRRLNGDIASLSGFKEDLVRRAEKLAVELAIVFAEAIILRKCEEDKDIIVDMAKKALEICDEKSGITIRMRREDAQRISQDDIYPLRVVPDDGLSDPGFVIETNFGDIDGTMTTQIESLRKTFLGS